MVLTLAVQGTDQFFVQRLLAARSRADAAWGVFASGLVVFGQFTLFLLIGVMLWVFYQQTPLPVPVDRADKIVSVYVLHNLGPGLAGLIIAAIVAAALSPSINALAATTVNDFYRPYVRPDADDAHLMRVSRIATVGWGLVQMAVALAAEHMAQGVLDAGLTVLGLSSGAVLGAFLIGTLRPSVGGSAVFAGMVGRHRDRARGLVGVADRVDLARAHRHDRDRHDRADGGAAGAAVTRASPAARVIAPPPLMPESAALAARVPAVEAVIRAALAAGRRPARVVEVGDADGVRGRVALGRLSNAAGAAAADADTIFDLASLTKVLATTLLAMRLEDAGRCATTDRVGRWWPAWYGPGRDDTTIADLLAHASGLAAHRPPLRGPARRGGLRRRDLPHAARGAAACRRGVQRPRLHPARRRCSSASATPGSPRRSPPMLGALTDAPLAYRPPAAWRARTASTGWEASRQRELVGEVHDANAWAMDGVAPHAGLFGTAGAVGDVGRAVLRALRGDGRRRACAARDRPPLRDAPDRRAGHDARAGLGHDEADVVVRALHEPDGDRPHRLHRHVALDRRRPRRPTSCCSPTASRRRHRPRRSGRCGAPSTTRSSRRPPHEPPAAAAARPRVRAAPCGVLCAVFFVGRLPAWPRSARCCRRWRRARAPASPKSGAS